MANFTVIYDACVFYPAPLRDFLMHLALTELFRARWTETIHEEWIASGLVYSLIGHRIGYSHSQEVSR